MKLFELKNWVLHVSEEAWGFPIFKKILDRDKSKNKETSLKEFLFIYHFVDLRSDYSIMVNEQERIDNIKKDIGLDKTWNVDSDLQAAINFYQEHSDTIISKLYKSAVKAVNDISVYLNNTESLLNERDKTGKPVYNLQQIVNGLKSVKSIMKDLKDAHNEVIAERDDLSGKKKGQQEFNIFEDGLDFEDDE